MPIFLFTAVSKKKVTLTSPTSMLQALHTILTTDQGGLGDGIGVMDTMVGMTHGGTDTIITTLTIGVQVGTITVTTAHTTTDMDTTITITEDTTIVVTTTMANQTEEPTTIDVHTAATT